MLSFFANWPNRRYGVAVVMLISLLLVVGAVPLAGKFEGAQKNTVSDFLPQGSESLKVAEVQSQLPAADASSAIVIASRDGGLLPADLASIKTLRANISASLPAGAQLSPSTPSYNNDAALFGVIYKNNSSRAKPEQITATIDALKSKVAAQQKNGLTTAVGGELGSAADAIKIFQGINSTLLITTGLLVFLLLLLIYRSPVFWILPFATVLIAELIARAGGYLLAQTGVVVNGQSAGILSVLVFGAGTDYALLLVARYREELRTDSAPRQAISVALQKTAPTIIASGSTVVAGLLCLSLAKVNAINGLGPAGAIGILSAMLCSLVILPALLLLGGRKAFWPFIPYPGSPTAQQGPWRKIGNKVAAHKNSVSVAVIAVLLLLSLGLSSLSQPLTADQSFRGQVESVKAQQMIAASFPAGASAPTLVFVPAAKDELQVRKSLRQLDAISNLAPAVSSPRGPQGSIIAATLNSSPGSSQAEKDITSIRAALAGSGALVGGSAAQEADLSSATERDNKVIIPIIVLVVLTILMLLLRSVTMPLMLMGTVLLSFAASLGATSWLSIHVMGAPGISSGLPIISLVFLVALGVDYNIFLTARAKEESYAHGAKEGMLRALAATGAVITSAGIVLAGTFAVLAVLPIWSLTQIGFAVAFGVLLDTFLVRSLLVPALSWTAGKKIWWPYRPKD